MCYECDSADSKGCGERLNPNDPSVKKINCPFGCYVKLYIYKITD